MCVGGKKCAKIWVYKMPQCVGIMIWKEHGDEQAVAFL